MSTGRNRDRDRAMTLNVIEGRCNLMKLDASKNWLQHDGDAATIDELLLEGATFDEIIMRCANRDENSVGDHLRHLRKEHGLPIYTTPRDGKIKFDHLVLGAERR